MLRGSDGSRLGRAWKTQFYRSYAPRNKVRGKTRMRKVGNGTLSRVAVCVSSKKNRRRGIVRSRGYQELIRKSGRARGKVDPEHAIFAIHSAAPLSRYKLYDLSQCRFNIGVSVARDTQRFPARDIQAVWRKTCDIRRKGGANLSTRTFHMLQTTACNFGILTEND